MKKSKKNKTTKDAVTGRLGAEAAIAFMRHNGAGVICSDKRSITRAIANSQAISEPY